MMLRPTLNHGRILTGNTPHGRFHFEMDADGVLVLYDFEIRDPTTGSSKPPVKWSITDGPGGLLHAVIAKITGETELPSCSCSKHIATMNEKGWLWCANPLNYSTIAAWIKESADLMAERAEADVDKLRDQLFAAQDRADRLQTTAARIDPDHTLTLLKAAIIEYRAKEAKPCPLRQPTDKP
jgi:hypothetical protein